MDFTLFLQTIKQKPEYVTKHPVVMFVGKHYPLFFFYTLFKHLQSCNLLIETIDCATVDSASLVAQLHTSFLGKSCIYWMGNVDQLSLKKAKVFVENIQEYDGPHTILFFTSKTNWYPKTTIQVGVPPTITGKVLEALANLFDKKVSKTVSDFIVSKQLELNLDEASLLLSYLSLVGTRDKEFLESWFPRLTTFNYSLFTLSQHFFSKNRAQFFPLWSSVVDEYAAPFWTTFWSDQLWKAHHYVLFSFQSKFEMAKQVSARLPFTFLKHGWKKYHSVDELKNAHDFIYDLDFAIKNGHGGSGFDLFYSKFFLDQFN